MLDLFKNKQVRGVYGEKLDEVAIERGHSTLEKPLNELNDISYKSNYRSQMIIHE